MDESYYSFISSPNNAGISFQGVDLQTMQSYCSTSNVISVCTRYTINSDSGYITNAYVEILTNDLTTTNPTHLFLVVAALGTLIGLVQYPEPCPFQDLMCASNPAVYPSTLDVYAARVLAEGERTTTVILPADIPYQQAPTLPVPEFQGTSALLAVTTIFSALILLRSGKTKIYTKRG